LDFLFLNKVRERYSFLSSRQQNQNAGAFAFTQTQHVARALSSNMTNMHICKQYNNSS
jgi:hypothetical protein